MSLSRIKTGEDSEMETILKMGFLLVSFILIFHGCVADVQMAPPPREPLPPPPTIRPQELKVTELIMSPDPVREGQRVSFQAVVVNLSRYSVRVNLFLKDRDEVITELYDVLIRPGENSILFPKTPYRFTREEYCFIIEVDIERTRRTVDMAKEFCARRTSYGWSMSLPRVDPLFIEDLDFLPDPVLPGREFRFRAKLRNDGNPLRANIRIVDRDQVVAQLNDVLLPHGISNFVFPSIPYAFQRFDHCFTVSVDVERTPYRVDAARKFCAKPIGWTLKPPSHRP